MIRVTQNRLNGKFVRAWNVDGVATRRAGVTDIVNIYDNQKDPARAKGALGPLPTPGDFDAPGQLTLTAGAYPVGVAKYLTKDISAIVGDWEFTVLCQRSYVEFGVTVTNAAGDKSVSILQRNTSFNNAVYRQTSFSGTVLAASFNDAAIYQSTDPIYYKVKKVGTNILYSTSVDGVTYTLRHTEPLITHLIIASRVGFYLGTDPLASGVIFRFTGVGANSSPYTDLFDDRSLNAAWVWYNNTDTAVVAEVSQTYGYQSDVLPLTVTPHTPQYGVDPTQVGVENQKDTLTLSPVLDFQYSASAALPTPYGNEDTLSLVPTLSFTHA